MAVFDPVGSPSDWGSAKVFDDPGKFNQYATQQTEHHLFIDEAGSLFDEGNDTQYNWIATRSRHWGHSVYFMAQRMVQIPKTVRDQCLKLYLFTSSSKDGTGHAEEWNQDILKQCNTLPRLHFYALGRYNPAVLYRVEKFKDIRPVRLTQDRSTGKVQVRKTVEGAMLEPSPNRKGLK